MDTEQRNNGNPRQHPSIDNALTNILSLPEVVKNVSTIHDGQTLEIRKQQKYLDVTQKKLNLAKTKERGNLEAFSNVTRQLYFCKEETLRQKETCNQLEKDILQLLRECTSQTSNIFHLKKTIKEENWKHEECRSKVIGYKNAVEKMKKASEDELSLKEMRRQVETLKTTWRAMRQSKDGETGSDGTERERNITEYEMLKIQEKTNEEKIKETKEKVEKLRSEINQTQQSTYVLHKRNKAQLTRLKRELKELVTLSGQWKETLTHLQVQISNQHEQV